MTNSCSNKVSLGKKPEKRYTFEIIWVNYVIMNPFLKTLMYGVGSARRLRILYLDLDLFNKKTYIYIHIYQIYSTKVICQHIPVWSWPASTAPVPSTKTQHPKASGVYHKVIALESWGVALQPSTKGSMEAHGSFNRTAKARSEERTNNTKDVVCNKPHSYERPPPHIRPHYAPLFCCNLVRL